MQKHITCIILAALMLINLCACSSKEGDNALPTEALTYEGFTNG